MISMIEKISDYEVNKVYNTNMPVGVRGRSSDNELILKSLKWQPKLTLSQGLDKTYEWIYDSIKNRYNHTSVFRVS